MLQVKYALNDLSQDEYAAIGRVLRTFSAIEHELMRTLIDANGGTNEACYKQLKKALRGSIKTRLAELIKKLTKLQNVIDSEWLRGFEKSLLEGCQVRDHYCHGFWRKDEDGKLWCDFYRRAKKNNDQQINNNVCITGVQLDVMPCSLDEIETTFQSNLHNLTVLEELQQKLKNL